MTTSPSAHVIGDSSAAKRLLATLLIAIYPLSSSPAAAEPVPLLTLHDAVGPATADYLVRNLQKAQVENAPLVIIEIDTPGGLDQAMRDINRSILDSHIPVACLVAPSGARAASAGTYILYACHIAAMAHGTNLGAATPVTLAGPMEHGGDKGDQPNPDKQEGADKKGGDAMSHKMINDAAAYIRSLAQLRGRNAEWAEHAVREAETLTATEALKRNVIDVIADTPAELLRRIDGRSVVLKDGATPQQLHTAELQIQPVAPDWRSRFLAVITNPNVAYVLMLIGIYGLILEMYSPGAVLPGTIGSISLLLALYAFQVLPINYSGFALILLGIGLMVAEAMVASFGLLGLGGITAFVIGSVLLFDSEVPGFNIALSLILGLAVVAAAALLLLICMIVKSRRQRRVTGMESWIGDRAAAVEDFESNGLVMIHGELWQAKSPSPVHKGQLLIITAIEGLRLQVEPAVASPIEKEKTL